MRRCAWGHHGEPRRIDVHVLLYGPARDGLRIRQALRHRAIRTVLSRDAGTWNLSAAIPIRSGVRLGGAQRRGHCENRGSRARGIPRGGRCEVKTRMAIGAAAIAASALVIVAQQDGGPYTAEQAAAGRAAYQANCAACHATDLSGREGPQLAGGTFMSQWGDKSVAELISFIQATMPPGATGSLRDAT